MFFSLDRLLCIYSKMIQGLTSHLDSSSNYLIKKSQNITIKTSIIFLKNHCYNRKLPTPFWRKNVLLKEWRLINCGLSSTTGSAEAAGSRVVPYAVRTYRHPYYCGLLCTVFHSFVFHVCVVKMWVYLWCGFFVTLPLLHLYHCKRAIHANDLTSADFFRSLFTIKWCQHNTVVKRLLISCSLSCWKVY